MLDPNLLACPQNMELLTQLASSGAWIDFTQGLDARLITAENAAVLAKCKTSKIYFALDDMPQIDTVQRGLELYAEAIGSITKRKMGVYILTNFNTTHEQDMERVRLVQKLGYRPYVMIYDKPNAPKATRDLQRWSNNPYIYYSTPNFEDYNRRS